MIRQGFHATRFDELVALIESGLQKFGTAGMLVSNEAPRRYVRPLTTAKRLKILRLYARSAATGRPNMVKVARQTGVHVNTVRRIIARAKRNTQR